MASPSFSRFLYCDTNVLSHFAKNQSEWPHLVKYLMAQDLTLAISSQVSELADVMRLHDSLAALLVSAPSALIKGWDEVLQEEVAAHPADRQVPLLLFPLNALLLEPNGIDKLKGFLSSEGLQTARREQRTAAGQLMSRHEALKGNFPPAGADGRYLREQSKLFAWTLVVQTLSDLYLDFLGQFKGNVALLNEYSFRSIRLRALVVFYKYYLGARAPRRRSDFGDLSHLYAIPYCSVVIVEKDLASTLRQIKRHDGVLADVTIYDSEFPYLLAQGRIG